MPVRNAHMESIDTFSGIDTLSNQANSPPNTWTDSMNVIVSAAGAAVALRSPYDLSTALSGANTVLSVFNATYNSSPMVLFDIPVPGSLAVRTYKFFTTFGFPAITSTVRSNQTVGARFCSLMVNDACYRLNGTEIIQIDSSSNVVKVGIDAPSTYLTPTISAGGSLVINVGISASFAGYNPTTGHVGLVSALTTIGIISGGNGTLTLNFPSMTQTGVTNVVLFLSTDGGSTRFLVTSGTVPGSVLVYGNGGAAGFTSAYTVDTNTTETSFNYRPSDVAFFMFKHQDRIFLLNFATAAMQSKILYSGLEAIGIGVPTEAYPPLNIVNIPVRSEKAVSGISTPVGALILSDRAGYLLTGQIIDIVVSAQNTQQASYRLEPLGWAVGTLSPYSLVVTPFGAIWFDQTKRIMLWPYSGVPREIGIPLRNALKAILDYPASRAVIEGAWYQDGEQQYYVLTAPTNTTSGYSTVNNRMFIVGVYEDTQSHELKFTTAVSDISAQALGVMTNANIFRPETRLMAGALNQINQIMQLDSAGSGFTSDQRIFFEVTSGNFEGNANFNHLHSIRYDASCQDITPITQDFDGGQSEAANPIAEPNSSSTMLAVLNRYGVHNKLRFQFPTDDSKRREIRNLRITYSGKGRTT